MGRDPLVPENPAQFVYPGDASYDKAFQVQLQGNSQVEVYIQGIMVSLKRPGERASGNGLKHRRFHFEIVPLVQETADFPNDPVAFDENRPYVRIDDQVDVSAAEPYFDVGQTVPFFGQRQEIFGQVM